MTKIDIFSGFLGAGKTTLIKKLIAEAYTGESLVLIENEFGEIGIDGAFLQDSGIEITEMNSGCICCSLVGDFSKSLQEVLERFRPDRILIEPSGVGKLSDVKAAIASVLSDTVTLNGAVAVVDAKKAKIYHKNFGEFFNNQIEHADCVVLSRTQDLPQDKLDRTLSLVRELNGTATVIAAPWDALSGGEILAAVEHRDTLDAALASLVEHVPCPVCGHVHEHHHEHGEHCDCHEHHHKHDEHCDCHEHHHKHDEHCDCHEHHHEHDEHCGCHEHHHEHDEHCDCHEHHHEHDEHCGCHEHHHEHDEHCGCHEHHHHHHADEVFTTWGKETMRRYTAEELQKCLQLLGDSDTVGTVLRAKGVVPSADGRWWHFDYVPEECELRTGAASVIGRLCVIGAELNETALASLFEG